MPNQKPKPTDTLKVFDDGSAQIQSATDAATVYTMQARLLNGVWTPTHCECEAHKAGRLCWHIKTYQAWLETHDVENDGIK